MGQAHGQGKEVNPDGSVRHDGEWKYDVPVRTGKVSASRRILSAM